MGIFKKNTSTGKSNIFQNLKSDITLNHFEVDIEGKKIKPIFNDKILKNVTVEMRNLPKGPLKDCKWMCIHHTNIAVFSAVKFGAREQKIKFDYTITEFYYHINFVDYLNILTVIQKACGLDPTNPVFN